MSNRKPHNDFAGYVCELRNKYSGGHTVISDCKLADEQGHGIVDDYKLEGGRYQVLCNDHGFLIYCTSLPTARGCMKDPTMFCMMCRVLAGECSVQDAGLTDDQINTLNANFNNTGTNQPQEEGKTS
jgi:hypothetical protein